MKKYKVVSEFLDDLDSKKRAQVDSLREIILNLGLEIEENIKWNAPNYHYKGVDRITFNLTNKEDKVKLIVHMGASKKENINGSPILEDKYGLVDWNSDIRGTITCYSLEDVNNKENYLRKFLRQWVKLMV